MLSFLELRLLVPHQGPVLHLLGRGAYSALQTPCWFLHAFGMRKGFWPFTNSIWNTKTVVRQSTWKNPCFYLANFLFLSLSQPTCSIYFCLCKQGANILSLIVLHLCCFYSSLFLSWLIGNGSALCNLLKIKEKNVHGGLKVQSGPELKN